MTNPPKATLSWVEQAIGFTEADKNYIDENSEIPVVTAYTRAFTATLELGITENRLDFLRNCLDDIRVEIISRKVKLSGYSPFG